MQTSVAVFQVYTLSYIYIDIKVTNYKVEMEYM